ncbi:hypothetical protein [Phenylobacterium sp.]|uniref:hypothetical protein n=1 Tax=Phenylobacterium sp. TaxID=1871053 RepID=UPI0039832975
MTDLAQIIGEDLAQPAPASAVAFARTLAEAFDDPVAVLFYGSALRTGDRDGVLDFYVLTRTSPRGLRGIASRGLWPDVSYRETSDDQGQLRAKVAAMTLTQFRRAVTGRGADTTIWTRFVQPAALVWSDSPETAQAVADAVAEAAKTAARFAAALGPVQGRPVDFWTSLFRETYAAEFRVERGREATLLVADGDRYNRLVAAAWRAGGIAVEAGDDGALTPQISAPERRRLVRAWRLRRALGRPLNIARLVKAAFTFDGAASYAAWKLERHTGLAIEVTPWRERHPILAAPGVLWRMWRAGR